MFQCLACSTGGGGGGSARDLDDDLPPEIAAMQAYLDETDFYKMVIVLNTELTMGTGKVSAQVAHAAIGKFTFLPPSNEVCEVMFSQVCLSTGGVRGEGGGGLRGERGCVCGKGGMHGEGGHVWQRGRAWRKGGGERAWQERRPLQWAVRILLECILVFYYYNLQK